MTLKIIGAGFGRTGTDSIRAALNVLGFPCYHMREVMKKGRSHVAFWEEVAAAPAAAQHDWERVFADYVAAVDFPASCVWPQLMEAYPGAKVLLSLHPGGPDAWYDSTFETIYGVGRGWRGRVLRFVLPTLGRLQAMARRLIWERYMEGTMDDREEAIQRYLRNVREVNSTVPVDRLLVYRVDQGWEPLCGLLGVPVPDVEFPHVNDRREMKRRLALMSALAYAAVIGGALLVAGLVVLLVAALT